MQVRTLDADDTAAFQALRLQGLREAPSAFASSYEEEAETPLATIAEHLARREDGAVFGAFEGQRLLGIAGLRRERLRKLAHKAHVWGVYVEPDARRRGVGRHLIERALSHAATSMGVRQVTLGVNAGNRAAIALYTSLGFERFGLEPGFMVVDGELHDEVNMVAIVRP